MLPNPQRFLAFPPPAGLHACWESQKQMAKMGRRLLLSDYVVLRVQYQHERDSGMMASRLNSIEHHPDIWAPQGFTSASLKAQVSDKGKSGLETRNACQETDSNSRDLFSTLHTCNIYGRDV